MVLEAINSNTFSKIKINMAPHHGQKMAGASPFKSFMKTEEELNADVFEKELMRKKEDAIERRRALFLIFSFISIGVLIATSWLYLKTKS